jgi:transposase InsO family protein
VLSVLTSQRFCDKSVAQTWATLLDEGTYLCSMSTMHRLLRANGAAGERRRQATHPAKQKPELLATGPGQVWSWDITKLRGPGRGIGFQLYVVLDIFSRYVVAWTVQAAEDSGIAKTMLEEAMGVHGIPEAVHADRGTSMTSKPVAQLLLDLGVERSHSRSRVSNDNPYSEAAFKTLKYAPSSPTRSGLWPMPALSARRSSATTTMSTVTPGSGCTPRLRCTTAPQPRSAPSGSTPSTQPTLLTPNGSATADPRHRSCPRPPGSTSPHRRPSYIPYGRAMSFRPAGSPS